MSAQKIVAIALAEVGYLEKASNANLDSKTANAGYNNYNKYARDIWPGLQANPWCDIFVSWCATQAGEIAAVGKYAYCPSHVNFFKGRGQWFARGAKFPQAGDIIFFQSGGEACHVGIVEYVSGDTVRTIEGNASGSSGLTPNGGGVCRKTYTLTSSYILGYGRPAYSSSGSGSSEATPSTSTTSEKEDFTTMKTWKNGSTEEPVYQDTRCTQKIGSLNPYESCDCFGQYNAAYGVIYKLDGSDHYKAGFVKYAGGVK